MSSSSACPRLIAGNYQIDIYPWRLHATCVGTWIRYSKHQKSQSATATDERGRLGVKTRIFHLGDYRRQNLGPGQEIPEDYFFVNGVL